MKLAIYCRNNLYYDTVIEYLISILKYIRYDLILYQNVDNIGNIVRNIKEYDYVIFVQKIPILVTNIKKYKQKIICINIEQLSREQYYNSILLRDYAIDYSHANIKLLNNKSLFFPYGINHDEIKNWDKPYDICFVGAISEKRKKILDELHNQKINVTCITDIKGNQRDEYVFRHKILINIHYDNTFKIYESIRCDRCIFNKMIVITESSLFDDELLIADKLIIVDYEHFVEKVINVLENYDSIYNELFHEYDKFMENYDNAIKKIYSDNIDTLKNNISH